MTVHVVSLLGLGSKELADRYVPIRYELNGRIAQPSPLFVESLRQLVPRDGETVEVTLLGSKEALEVWRPSDDNGLFRKHFRGSAATAIEVPTGKNASDLLQVFRNIQGAFDRIPDATLVMDVTNGFRSQPLLAVAALLFHRAELVRRGRTLPTTRIIYGAFDAREGDVAPAWDLTPLLVASQWSAALDAVMRYGRADDLEQLAKEMSGEWVRQARAEGQGAAELAVHAYPGRLGKAVRVVADDLATGRMKSLFGSSVPAALHLLDASHDHLKSLLTRFPLLATPISDLREWLAPLKSPNVLGPEGRLATAHYAVQLGRLQRFAEQAAAVREGLITHVGLLLDRQPVEPGMGCSAARGEVEGDRLFGFRNQEHERRDVLERHGEPMLAALQLWTKVCGVRNDVEHLGINDGPSDAGTIRTKLDGYSRDFLALLTTAEPDQPVRPASAVFVNLSNHPISTWSPTQRDAAAVLGAPVELSDGMPLIEPTATRDDVAELAERIAARAVAQGATSAHVATEPTFTVALVRALQARGVRCYAATTDRQSTVTTEANGSVQKLSRFSFVAWREHPTT